jgi:hypothetical protein
MRTPGALDALDEEIREARFYRISVAHVAETSEGIRRLEQLGGGKRRSATRSERPKTDGPFRELRSQRQDEELQICARIHEFVVLTRLKDDHFAGRQSKRAVADAEHAVSRNDQVDLRLVVKMPRAPERRLVPPDLSSPARKHGKGLK